MAAPGRRIVQREPQSPSVDDLGSDDHFDVSFVVTTYRDPQRCGTALKRIRAYLANAPVRGEVVAVDDASKDATPRIVSRWWSHFDGLVLARHGDRRGRGIAARTGALVARGRYIVVVDDPLAPIEETGALLESLHVGADVAVAARERSELEYEQDQRPFLEKATETTVHTLSQMMLPLGMRDHLPGMVGFRRRAARRIAQVSRVEGPGFFIEWLALAQWLGFQLMECEVPHGSPTPGESTAAARPSRQTLSILRDVWRTKRRLDAEGYSGTATADSLLKDTSFYRLDRAALMSGERVPTI